MLPMKQASALGALVAATMLAGCVSIGPKPPQQLLTLDAARKVPSGTPQPLAGGGTLYVADPDAPRELDTVRIPVQTGPTSVAYVTKVQWSDTPRHLFRRLLAETISASTNRVVLDIGQLSDDASERLTGELLAFSIDKSSGSAVVTYDAALTDHAGKVLARQRFTASAPVGGKIDAATVGAPLNAAANRVAADVAAWVAAARK